MILKLAYQENDPVDDPYWDETRNHDYSQSFPAVKNFIHQNSQRMRSPRRSRRRIAWVLAVFLPLLIFFSCRRQTYIQPQGTTLSFISNDSVQLLIEHTIKQYAEKPWRVVFRSYAGRMQCTIKAPGESYSKLNAFTEKLRTIPSVAELYLSSLSTTVKESRISRLSYKIFNEHLDATSASQEQLANQIERKLREEGLDSLMVQMLKENESIHMVFTPTGKNHDFSLDITLDDGTKVSAKADKWQ